MSYFYLKIKKITRSNGQSAIASSAYRAGERLTDEETGNIHNYHNKGGVYYSEIMLPENAPRSFQDRATLGNEVERIENKSNSVLARDIVIALPNELASLEPGQVSKEHIAMCREYIEDAFVSKGMCADFAIHCPKNSTNGHCHIMTTVRGFEPDGSWSKKERKAYALDEQGNKIPITDEGTGLQKIEAKTNRKMGKREVVLANDGNKKENVEMGRKSGADACNKGIEKYNIENKKEVELIDHRSYIRRGINRIPMLHEGGFSRKIKEKFGSSDISRANDEIREINKELQLFDKLKADFNKAMEIVKTKTEEIREGFKNNFDDVETVKRHRRRMSL